MASKDPAFLFYSSDFLTGTALMSDTEVGVYIRLLCVQHQHGGFIGKEGFERITTEFPGVAEKFIQCEHGYYNSRLMEEMAKRTKKSKSLSDNAKTRWEKHHRCKSDANTRANDGGLQMPTEDEDEKHLEASTDKYSSAAIAAFIQEFVTTVQGVDPKFRITQQDRVQAHTVLDELLNRDGYTIDDIKQTASEAKRRDMHYKSISTLAKYLRNGTFRA